MKVRRGVGEIGKIERERRVKIDGDRRKYNFRSNQCCLVTRIQRFITLTFRN